MSFFPVSLYIAVFATSISSPLSATIVLALFNVSGVLGQIFIGYLSDVLPYPWIMFSSSLGSAIAAFLLWGFADTLTQVFAFAIIFGGLVRPSFTSILMRVHVDINASKTRPVVFRPSALLRHQTLRVRIPNKPQWRWEPLLSSKDLRLSLARLFQAYYSNLENPPRLGRLAVMGNLASDQWRSSSARVPWLPQFQAWLSLPREGWRLEVPFGLMDGSVFTLRDPVRDHGGAGCNSAQNSYLKTMYVP